MPPAQHLIKADSLSENLKKQNFICEGGEIITKSIFPAKGKDQTFKFTGSGSQTG